MKFNLRKLILKSGFSIATAFVLFINIGMILNLMLNKQYVVNELSSSIKAVSFEGMEEIISNDYVGMFYYLIINSILSIFLLIAFLRKKAP